MQRSNCLPARTSSAINQTRGMLITIGILPLLIIFSGALFYSKIANGRAQARKLSRGLKNLHPTSPFRSQMSLYENTFLMRFFGINRPNAFINSMDDDAGAMSAWYLLA